MCIVVIIIVFMIIINIVLTFWVSTAFLSHDRDLHEIKVVYDHPCIASYRHLRVGNIGGYWLLEGNECSAAGGFPSNLKKQIQFQNSFECNIL